MPDAETILVFLAQVLGTPLRWVFTFFGALAIILLVLDHIKEFVQQWT